MLRTRIIVVASLIVALTPGSAHAIVKGTLDGTRHPYVGMVFQQDDQATGSYGACSGTLVAPRVFITAAHCTEGLASGTQPIEVTFAPDARDFVAQAGGVAHTYPGFCEGCGGAWGRNLGDIGVIVLDKPISLGQYGVLPAPGALDDPGAISTVTHAGYGVASGAAGCAFYRCLPGDFGVRMQATSQLVSAGSLSQTYVKTAKGPSGMCFGDSGSPVLAGDGPTVLAVHAYVTDWSCAGVAYATRLDRPEVLSWIRSWM